VRYDISYDSARNRWYADASWKAPGRAVPPLDELRASPVVSVDVNAGHLAVAVVAPDGNVTGTPFSIPLHLAGLPATARDGRVRATVSRLIATAREHGARAVVIENLDFAQARAEGREAALAGQAGQGIPAARRGPPHRPVPGPPHSDDRERRPVGRGR
jgi:hypothetical protein